MIRKYSNCSRLLSMFMLMLVGCCCKVLAFTGSDLTSGQSYYLYNIYQAKFLSWGNQWGTQASLDNYRPLRVTITSSGSGYTINTHLEPTADGVVVNSSYDNYLLDTEWSEVHWPVVNAKYYENGSVINRDATVWTIAKHSSSGYYQISCTNGYLAFNEKNIHVGTQEEGWACELTNDLSYAPDRSYWQLISETEYAEWTAKKKVTIASLNVDGMPKSVKVYGIYPIDLNDDANEGPGATAIGNRLRESGFDVVGVSEDFNYHSELWSAAWNDGIGIHYNAMTHRNEINASAAGILTKYRNKEPIADTDGLGLFYRIDGSTTIATPSQESWTQWNDHNGYTDSGADGLIKKGYRYYLITLADGTELDLYTLHMDAEDNPGDNAARESQMTQLVNAIKATNNKRPIIIIGDTNCRYTRDKVKELLIDAINADDRFTCRDPWIQYGRGNRYPAYGTGSIMASANGYLRGEVVDKIFYINNKESDIRLTAESYAQDLSFVWEKDGEISPLCDHKPCVVTFSYHTYDPTIDDVAIIETTEEAVYLRNRGTGRFLKSGGAWGTHAVVGNYPMGFTMELNDGKYTLKSPAGYLTDASQPFVDGSSCKYTLLEQNGYYFLTCNNGALSANDPYIFEKDDPNYRWVINTTLNTSDKLQQWEILTKEQMLAELAKATPMNPVNASWLMGNPNFDRNVPVTSWEGYPTTATRMTSNLADGENDGDADDNYCAEIYVANCTKTHWGDCDHSQIWDIHQKVTDIPNGYYRVSCQAFQRVSNSTSTTADIKFYAGSEYTDVELMYNLKAVTKEGMGSTQSGGYYYPNSMAEASLYFNEGYYKNELIVQVTNQELTIGIKKTSGTGINNHCWTCFDNFQLIYLGPNAPESSYYLYNVESGRYLNGGNAYGTQASIAEDGQAWIPVYTSSGVKYTRSDSKGLFVAGNGLYVDGATPGVWTTKMDANGAMTIAPVNNPEYPIGWTSEEKGTVVRDGFKDGERELCDGINWVAVPTSQYSTFKTNHAGQYAARTAAVATYRTACLDGHTDYADFQSAWHDPSTSAADITTKTTALKTAMQTEAIANSTHEDRHNVSFYINNATCGDDAHTGWTKESTWGSVTTATYNNNGIVLAPRFYEKYDDTKLPDAKISQTISDIPAGYYAVALDVNAQKQSDTSASVTGVKLYIKSGEDIQYVECDTHGEGARPATFTTDEITVKPGETTSLEIGLQLDNTNANWVAFDNWQLIFCSPYREIALDNETTPTKWVMKGTWRESNMEEVKTTIDANPKLLLDVTGATLVGKPNIPTADAAPNMMIKANSADDVANTVNVLVDNECAQLVITDKKDFAPLQDFTSKKAAYIRTNTQGYNTVCMPFQVKKSDFPNTCTLYKYKETGKDVVRFTEVDDDEMIDEGTPILVKDDTDKQGDEAVWVIEIEDSRSVVASVSGNTHDGEKSGVNGSFLNRMLGAGYYKLYYDGTIFVPTVANVSTITPFRFYLYEGENSGPAKSFSIAIGEDEETTIEEILTSPETKIEKTYDLNGRQVINISHPGIYIKGGKKVFIK